MAWDSYSGGYSQYDPYENPQGPTSQESGAPSFYGTPSSSSNVNAYMDQATRAANAQAAGGMTNLYGGYGGSGGGGGGATQSPPAIGGKQSKDKPVSANPGQILTPQSGDAGLLPFQAYQPDLRNFLNFLKFASQFGPMMYGNSMQRGY